MASVNTNYGASIALQNLNKTNSELERTQNRINTGMKVSSAKDSGAIFAIATSQRAAASAQDSVRSSIQRGQSIVDVALAAHAATEGPTRTGRLAAMRFFFHYELPKIGAWLQVVSNRDQTCAALPEEAF